ncbi:uncharacterized protein LOC143275980 [Babylonia areolata]|uniref:uncharacterized protein LOC143275980 n=1 Tax=Babylonia areolata TaxID=304850 RepID=UPI003FD1C343
MRGALENCRNKVEELRDDITEKEKTIEDERKRRKEAEKRLRQHLVDPYGSPEVNSELRNRLPRAGKADPLLDVQEVVESSEHSEADEEQLTTSRASGNKAYSSLSPKGAKRSNKSVRRVLNFQPPPRTPHHSQNGANQGSDTEGSGTEAEDAHHHREARSRQRRGRIKSHHSAAEPSSTFPPPHYRHYAPPGMPAYPVGHYPSPMYAAPFSLTPWSSVSSLGVMPPAYHPVGAGQARAGIPLSRSFPLLNGELAAGGFGASAAGLPGGAAEKTQPSCSADSVGASALNPDSHPSQPLVAASTNNQAPPSSELHSSPAQKPSNPFEQNPAAQKSAVPASELFSQSASSMGSSSYQGLPAALPRESEGRVGDGERFLPSFSHAGVPAFPMPLLHAGGSSPLMDVSARHTSLLQDEVGRLKDSNQQLAEKLAMCTKEVETLKLQILTETPKDGTLDSVAAQKLADLMSEVRAAEKRRREAMEARVAQAEQAKEQVIRDFENTLLRASIEKGSGRRLTMKDLSSASETEESDSEEDEEGEGMKELRADDPHHPAPPPRESGDAGRLASLKDALKEMKERSQRELCIYREELQVVMEQRDQALHQLQAERERTQLQHLHMPTQREQVMMAKISALQREKDRAESSLQQLKEEQVERNLYISLHKALFTDSALNETEKTDPAISKVRKKVAGDGVDDDDNDDNVGKEDESPVTMKEDNQLLEQLRQANQEKSLLQMRCEELEALCKQEKEEKNRLERLNGVLRRKLIAVANSDRQVSQEE